MIRINRWIKYIAWRRAYWDSVIEYGFNYVVTRYCRIQVYRLATKKQYDFTIKYSEKL